MALFPELNEDETVENVRELFESDLPKLQNMAHVNYIEAKAQVISGMPSGGSRGNSSLDKSNNYAYANSMLSEIIDACDSMRAPHREFLELRYFKGLEWLEIEIRTGYSTRRGLQIIREAFLQFAWAFSDIKDLRVFK